MAPRRENVAQVFLLLGVDLTAHPLEQHFGEPDDRVEWCAELVRHVREELALVPARHFELLTLLLDLIEEAYVLDRDRRLISEGLDELYLTVGERPHVVAGEDHRADRVPFAKHRHAEHGAYIGQTDDTRPSEHRIGLRVSDVDDGTLLQDRPHDAALGTERPPVAGDVRGRPFPNKLRLDVLREARRIGDRLKALAVDAREPADRRA